MNTNEREWAMQDRRMPMNAQLICCRIADPCSSVSENPAPEQEPANPALSTNQPFLSSPGVDPVIHDCNPRGLGTMDPRVKRGDDKRREPYSEQQVLTVSVFICVHLCQRIQGLNKNWLSQGYMPIRFLCHHRARPGDP